MDSGSFQWQGHDDQGANLTASALTQTFDSQAEAETWMASQWAVLLESGVAAVTLREGEEAVYGPMPLTTD